MSYKIVRMFLSSKPSRVIQKGLTLEEAQSWCKNPETSSNTCTSSVCIARTRMSGKWFEGYEEE